jgi:hypothetical protein
MVKNAGGNKSKKVARKNVGGGSTATQDVRKAVDACEMYASVTKIYSSQRCSVLGADGNTYQCTIRGKFLKNKRSGEGLINGAWILIGFYDWEVRSDGSKKCDLLEIYSNLEKDKLKQSEARHLAGLIKNDTSDGGNCTFSTFHIENSDEEEEEEKDKESEEGSSSDEETSFEPVSAAPAPAVPTVPAPVIKRARETTAEQLDWLNISSKDI